MKNFFLIICVLISADLFAQGKVVVVQHATKEYYVKTAEDTVFCDIKKIDLDKIKLDNNDILSADSIKAFLFENIKWTSYAVQQFNKKKNNFEFVHIFLPEINYGTMGFNLGNWGKALGTKHNYSILCRTNGATTLYEIEGDFNSGSFSSPANFLLGGNLSTESTIYIKNEELGVTKMHYAKKKSPEANQEIIEVLKKYTKDKPQIAAQLDNNFSAKYGNVKAYLEQYIQSK